MHELARVVGILVQIPQNTMLFCGRIPPPPENENVADLGRLAKVRFGRFGQTLGNRM